MNKLIYLFIFIFLITSVSADLGYYKPNTCVELIGSSNGTSMNISSISYPNGSVMHKTLPMTKQDKTFNYTFCDTSITGKYNYIYYDSYGTIWTNNLIINAQGKEYTSDGIIYGVMFLVLIGVFILSLYIFKDTPFDNPKNEYGELVGVDWKKYIKIGALTIAYVTAIVLSYFSWNIAYGILEFSEMANIFLVIFKVLMIGLYLVVPIVFVFVLIVFIKDLNILKDVQRGFNTK